MFRFIAARGVGGVHPADLSVVTGGYVWGALSMGGQLYACVLLAEIGRRTGDRLIRSDQSASELARLLRGDHATAIGAWACWA